MPRPHQMGQVFQMEFAGVVTSLEPIRYPSKRKVRHYRCISRC